MAVSIIRLCDRLEMIKLKATVIDGRLPLRESIIYREFLQSQINTLSATLNLWWAGQVPGYEIGTDEDEKSEKKWEDMWRDV